MNKTELKKRSLPLLSVLLIIVPLFLQQSFLNRWVGLVNPVVVFLIWNFPLMDCDEINYIMNKFGSQASNDATNEPK